MGVHIDQETAVCGGGASGGMSASFDGDLDVVFMSIFEGDGDALVGLGNQACSSWFLGCARPTGYRFRICVFIT